MLGIVYKRLATSCHFLPHPQNTRSQENTNTDDTLCDSKNSNKSHDIHVTGLPALVLDVYYRSRKYTMGSHNQSLPRRNETSENLKTLSRTGRGVVSGCGLFLLDMPRGKHLFAQFFALRLFLLILVSSTPVLVYLRLLRPTHRDPAIRHHFTPSLSLPHRRLCQFLFHFFHFFLALQNQERLVTTGRHGNICTRTCWRLLLTRLKQPLTISQNNRLKE